MVLALVIFLITYALMLMLQKWRPYIALASAAVFVILGCCGVQALGQRYFFAHSVFCPVRHRLGKRAGHREAMKSGRGRLYRQR